MTSLRGRLLVAEPGLVDPNFARSVVYLIEHSGRGALGLVLNRPGDVSVREAVPTWAPYVQGIDQVFQGGPVSPEGAICLARRTTEGPEVAGLFHDLDDDLPDAPFGSEPPPPGRGGTTSVFRPITRTIGVIDLHGDPGEAPGGVRGLRIFAGYAGWSGGQLEGELDLGGWYVVDAEDDDVFTERPGTLWRDVLARQRGSLRAVAHHPEDPSVN